MIRYFKLFLSLILAIRLGECQTCTGSEVLLDLTCVKPPAQLYQINNKNIIANIYYQLTDADELDMVVQFQATGWMSIGFGQQMKAGFDCIVFQSSKIIDMYVKGYTTPVEDSVQNVVLTGKGKQNSFTNVRFRRKLNTGDSEDKIVIKNSPTPMSIAYGNSGAVSDHQNNFEVFSLTFVEPGCTEDTHFLFPENCLKKPLDSMYVAEPQKTIQFWMYWTFVDFISIDFIFVYPSTGYFTFGYGTAMKAGFDTIIFEKNTIFDCYVQGYNFPVRNEQQDYLLKGYYENATHTTFWVNRKLDTQDPKDKILAINQSLSFSAYYGKAATIQYHGKSFIVSAVDLTSHLQLDQCLENQFYFNNKCTDFPRNKFRVVNFKQSPDFIDCNLYWTINNTNITFALQYPVQTLKQNWFALGFGQDMLAGFDVIVFQSGNIFDGHVLGEKAPTFNEVAHVNLDLQGYNNPNTKVVQFTRKLNTSEALDIVLNNSTYFNLSLCYGDEPSIVEHGRKITEFMLRFDTVRQEPVCNNEFLFKGRCIPYPFNRIAAKNNFTSVNLFWDYPNQIEIQFYLRVPAKLGWLALGFGDDMTKGFDLLLVQQSQLFDAYVKGFNAPTISYSAPQDQRLISMEYQNGFSYVVLKRVLKSTNATKSGLVPNTFQTFSVCFGEEPTIKPHGDYIIDFSTNLTNRTSPPESGCLLEQISINNQCISLPENSQKILKEGLIDCTIYWSFQANNQISFIIQFPAESNWFSLGFGSSMGSGFDVILYQKETIIDQYVKGYSYPTDDTNQNIDFEGSDTKNNSKFIKFSRLLNTGDASDQVLQADKAYDISVCYGPEQAIVPHNEKLAIAKLILKQQPNSVVLCTEGQISLNSNCVTLPKKQLHLQNSNLDAYLYWNLLENNQKVEFFITFPDKGWVSLGFGSAMSAGFDTIVCQQQQCSDYFVKGYTSPVLDSQQDLTLLGYGTQNSKVNYHFSRLLDTKDKNDKVLDLTSEFDMSICYGKEDQIVYHGNVLMIFKLTLSDSSSIVDNKTDSGCTEKQLLISNKCVDPPPAKVQVKSQYIDTTIYWEFKGDKIEFTVTTPTLGWYSLGFGKTMSSGFDVITIEGDKVYDCYVKGYIAPVKDTQQDITIISSPSKNSLRILQAQSNYVYRFSRPLNTNDTQDKTLKEGDNLDMSVCYGSEPQLVYHKEKLAIFSIKLDKIADSTSTSTSIDPYMLSLHQEILFWCWMLVIDLILFPIEIAKSNRIASNIHSYGSTVLIVLTIFLEGIIIHQNKAKLSSLGDSNTISHFVLGLIFLILIIAQTGSGFILQLIQVGGIMSTKIKLAKAIHLYLGIAIYIFGKVTVLIGAKMQLDRESGKNQIVSNFVLGLFLLVFTLTFRVFAYLFMYLRKRKQYFVNEDISFQVPQQITPLQTEHSMELGLMRNYSSSAFKTQLISLLNQGISRSQIQKQLNEPKYILLGNKVFDVAEFIHPGGQIFITENYGCEISRYFYGVVGLESTSVPPYTHKPSHLAGLKQSFYGVITPYKSILFSQNPNELGNVPTHLDFCVWRLVSVEIISSSTNAFHFANGKTKVKSYQEGIQWFGKHFLLQQNPTGPVRIYTTVLCVNKNYQLYYSSALQYVKSVLDASKQSPSKFNPLKESVVSQKEFSLPQEFETFTDDLILVVKKYPGNGLSQYLHRAAIESEFLINGPVGLPLELNPYCNNTYIFFCAGTGILPFLDLLYFLMSKIFQKIINKFLGNSTAEHFDILGQGLSKYFEAPNLKFKFYCSFASEDEWIGSEMLQNLNLFQSYIYPGSEHYFVQTSLRFSNGYKPKSMNLFTKRFNKEFIQESLKDVNLEKAFICGPNPMVKEIVQLLKSQKVSNDKIQIV